MMLNKWMQIGAAATALLASAAAAQECEWADTFRFTGPIGEINTMTVFDDGAGSKLYMGGNEVETSTGTYGMVLGWNGDELAPFPQQLSDDVDRLAVFDLGDGPRLHMLDGFSTSVWGMSRWDGQEWGRVTSNDNVGGATLFDAVTYGSDTHLYVAGAFTSAGGISANRIARWDGAQWLPLGSGLNGTARALCVWDQDLYVGGQFPTAGGVTVNRIARWNGSAWAAVGTGFNATVSSLVIHDEDGAGPGQPALFAAGSFTTSGSTTLPRIAKWTGMEWVAVGSPPITIDDALHSFDDGSGPALYAVGRDANNDDQVAKWNGSEWSLVGQAIEEGDINVIHGFGDQLLIGGTFALAGETHSVATLIGNEWVKLPMPAPELRLGLDDMAFGLATFDSGRGPEVYVCGEFNKAGDNVVNGIARWDGAGWSELVSGLGGGQTFPPYGITLEVLDLGGGPALYVGGGFLTAGDVSARSVAKWDGSAWSSVGEPLVGYVAALATHDDGDGLALYAGGLATQQMMQYGLFKLAQGAWIPVQPAIRPVWALQSFDDGSGTALFVGGYYLVSGNARGYIAKWDGKNWTDIGGPDLGVSSTVFDFEVFDDGNGPALYAAGTFSMIGGLPITGVAKWNGAEWSAVGGSLDSRGAACLLGSSDESGPKLYVGGYFGAAGGVPARNIAVWNGKEWTAVPGDPNDVVWALTQAPTSPSGGNELWIGGDFTQVGSAPSSMYIARLTCEDAAPCPADFAPAGGDGSVDVNDLLALVGAWGDCPAPCAADIAPAGGDGVVDVNDLLILIGGWGPCP